jgi:hypothetical protein
MISAKSLNPCNILALHSNPRPLNPLNPGEERNVLGDDQILYFFGDTIITIFLPSSLGC